MVIGSIASSRAALPVLSPVPRAVAQFERHATRGDRAGGAGSIREPKSLTPGTLLTREWKGHLQQVMVVADGFSWHGKTYRSLSQVAFAVTGTRWSGPRFFGLDKPSSEGRP